MSKYAYPPNRPAPADPSVSGRIATLNPISKCLQVALDELLTEDQSDGEDDSIGLNRESMQYASSIKGKESSDVDESKEQSAMTQSSDEHNIHASEIHNNNIIRIDETISKSILDSYSNAVSTTKYDDDHEKQTFSRSFLPPHDNKFNNKTNTRSCCQQAPAAIIQGEIDHYNRVGSNWRIIVKNATLKSRSVTKIGNGLDGRRYRSRTVLDWDDDDDDDKVDGTSSSCKKKRAVDSSTMGSSAKRTGDTTTKDDNMHRFEGTVQILAYDDRC